MRILGSVVSPLTALVAFCDPKITGCSSIRSQLICDQLVWDKAIFLQKLAHEFQRRPLVPFRLDQHIEDLALGVDGAPQIDHPAIDFQIDFIKMPSRIGFGSAFAQVRRDHRSEVVHPAPDSFVGHHDTAFRQQIFDVAKAQGKPDVKPDRLLDDFQREPVPLVADFLHPPGYLTASGTASPNRRDKARRTPSRRTCSRSGAGDGTPPTLVCPLTNVTFLSKGRRRKLSAAGSHSGRSPPAMRSGSWFSATAPVGL